MTSSSSGDYLAPTVKKHGNDHSANRVAGFKTVGLPAENWCRAEWYWIELREAPVGPVLEGLVTTCGSLRPSSRSRESEPLNRAFARVFTMLDLMRHGGALHSVPRCRRRRQAPHAQSGE